ncbi:MAG: hypothetical protein EOP51_02405 [Sphingobacteriales bacterium]|nr:MAG: hypothetical protein EOP51_02405 [Sphingobacteriales bacterium]
MKFLTKFYLVLPLLTLPILAHAQGGADCGVPLDGGISLLVAAGVGYGAKKMAARKKAAAEQQGK